MFCSFCGTLEEALQLAASPGLAAAHMQARAAGRGENMQFPAELMEISSLSSQQWGQSSVPRPALLVSPSSKQHTEEDCGFHAVLFWRAVSLPARTALCTCM